MRCPGVSGVFASLHIPAHAIAALFIAVVDRGRRHIQRQARCPLARLCQTNKGARGMMRRPRLVCLARLFAATLAALVAAGSQAFAQPTVTSVSTNPFSYLGGQTVTINGSGFYCGSMSTSCVTAVTIGGVAATNINVTSDGTLTATTPADGTPPSSPTVSAFPSGITPDYGPTSGGQGVTVNGTGFGHAVDVVVTTSGSPGTGTGIGLFTYNDVEQVSIGGTNASSFTFVNATQLTTSTPPGVTGVGNVIVTTAGGNTGSTGNNEFAYTQGGPSISAILPDSGLTNIASNTPVTISGSNFVPGNFQDGTPATTVTFGCGSTTNTTTSSVSNVSIVTAAVPNCATAGAATVTVKLPGGSTATYNYLYVGPQTPIVTGITNTNGSSPFDGQAKGSTEGGDQVTISGSYFTGATAVAIGGTAVSAFTVQDPGHITTTTPPGTAGLTSVSVTVPQASTPTGTANIFTYVQPVPQVTSVLPNYGGTAGGNQITIRGSGFTAATKVSFGSNFINCPASCTVASDNEIDVIATPASSSATTVDLLVTTPGGTSTASSLDQFTYIALPTVTGLSPTSGPAAGGTTVTITGTGFTNASTVKFGSVTANVTNFGGSTQLTATAPVGAAGSTVDVQVSIQATLPGSSSPGTFFSAAVSSDKYTYQGPPTVNSVSPNAGSTAGGYDVKINGASFTGATHVTVGGIAVSGFTVSSDSVIDVPNWPGGTVGAASVVVTTPNGSNAANSLFTYYAPSTGVTSSPTSGPIGTTVTITGNNFAGRITVAFGANQATTFSVNSTTQITAIAPPGTGTVPVTVTTPAGTVTSANTFTYTVPPTISITPPQGPTGASVVITASAGVLTGATAVQFGGVNATSFTLNSPTQITATAPPGSGTVSVTVATPNGTATSSNQFTYLGVPTVTSVSPPSGPLAGNYQVTISGTSLTGASAVKFGSTPATTFTYSSATQQITATVPAGTGTVDLTVTTPLGTSAINRPGDQFTYTTAPAVTGISPTSGPSIGGTSVTITGNNLAGATAVKFGGTAGTITSSGPTTIVVTSPPGSGTVDVTVTTTAGTSAANSADRFTYIPPAPTITGFTPASGPTAGGTSVTITGTNLSGATSVTFGTTSGAITANTAGSITVTSPPGTGAVALTVTTPGGSVTSTGKFTYTAPAPTVTSVSPNVGPVGGGATVTITGTNFIGVSAVKFGSINATSFQTNSQTQITATTPAGNAGAVVDVTVTTSAATSAINQPGDQYTYSGPPAVTGLSPNTGPSAGGTSVTITGSNFSGATAVNFGSTPGTSLSVNGSGTLITVLSPPGSGTVNVTVVTPSSTSAISPLDRFTYGKATTSLTLTSSPNPSSYGQPVTFTALVTGNAPTGTVTFSQGGTTLGTAPLGNITATSASAVFTISTLQRGADLVTANYGGDANNGPDPVTVTQIVNAPADSVRLRETQIAAMSVESNASAAAITGAIDNAIGAGFSGTCPIAPTPNGSGFTYCFDGEQSAQNPRPAQQARARIDDDFAVLGYDDGLPGTRWSAPQDSRLAGDLTPYASRPAVVPYNQPRAWLAWVDVRVSQVVRTGSTNNLSSDLSGLQGNAMFGLTRTFLPNFLIGLTAGYEDFNYKVDAYNGVLRGQGVTGGGYLGWLFGQHLRFEAAGTWSDIFVNDSAGTASGQFTGQRWLGFGNLTGNFGWLDTMFEPSAQVYTLWEHENAYTDSLGTPQGTHDFDTGRASGGLKVSQAFSVGTTKVVPYLGLYGDYYFTMDNANGAPGLTPVPLMQGWAARTSGGITAALPNGAQMSVGGELSGIGNTTQILTVTVRGSVPF
jgi:hypothetical protein